MSIPPQERENVRSNLFTLVRDVERYNSSNPDENTIQTSVQRWESQQYEKFRNQPEEYRQAAKKKLEKIQASLEEKRKASKAASSASSVNVTETRQAGVPSQRPSMVSQQTATLTPTRSRPRVIEEIREPLEQCRSILRVLNLFGDRKDGPLKEEFLRIYKETTETIKSQKSTQVHYDVVQGKVQKIDRDLTTLREKLDPRLEAVKKLVKLNSLNEVLERDGQLCAILERVMEVSLHQKQQGDNTANERLNMYSYRARVASSALGGKHSLKRTRIQPNYNDRMG